MSSSLCQQSLRATKASIAKGHQTMGSGTWV